MKHQSKLATTHDVQAYLSGRKTQFREPVKWNSFSENKGGTVNFEIKKGNIWNAGSNVFADSLGGAFFGILEFAKYQVGSLVYLREAFAVVDQNPFYAHPVIFQADYTKGETTKQLDIDRWRPSTTMPKSIARIWIQITAVRVERVQDINAADAISEGAVWTDNGPVDWAKERGLTFEEANPVAGWKRGWSHVGETHPDRCLATARSSFGNLWGSKHPDSWERNDYVFAYECKLLSTSGKPIEI